MNCTERLSEIAIKLDEMSNDLYKSGIVGYSMSLRTMSKSIKEVIESIEIENKTIMDVWNRMKKGKETVLEW